MYAASKMTDFIISSGIRECASFSTVFPPPPPLYVRERARERIRDVNKLFCVSIKKKKKTYQRSLFCVCVCV